LLPDVIDEGRVAVLYLQLDLAQCLASVAADADNLAFVDRSLGRLIAAYGTTPNVIVVSDHGFEANTTHPMWRGWHSARGIAIAAGPSFPHRDARLAVSYYDVVPTVMDVVGLAAPDGMRGSSLLRR